MPKHKNIVGCRWTLRLKKNSDGTVQKHKARSVTKGYTQQQGFNFTETLSPVVKPTTIRVFLIAAQQLKNQATGCKQCFLK